VVFQLEKTSDYIAVVALLLSAASLYITWRHERRDASRLKIGLTYGPDPVRGPGYTVRVTNVGRRPASIAAVYARTRGGKRYPVMDRTTPLAETEFREVSVPMSGFGNRQPSSITAFEVEDTTGTVYKASTRKYWKNDPA
jgi:hypothetical protein